MIGVDEEVTGGTFHFRSVYERLDTVRVAVHRDEEHDSWTTLCPSSGTLPTILFWQPASSRKAGSDISLGEGAQSEPDLSLPASATPEGLLGIEVVDAGKMTHASKVRK